MLGQNAGLTQLQFSTDGRRLYSAGRKCGELLCWDMRNLGQILFAMKRPASTNQRLYFDLNASSSYLVSGDQSGQLNWWDVRSIEADRTPDSCLSPTMSWNCESDCLNSVSLHPTLPIVVTGSGQRHFGKLLNQNCEDADLVFSHTPNGQNWMRLWWSADLTQFNQVYSQSS